jgi:hypothetical protein
MQIFGTVTSSSMRVNTSLCKKRKKRERERERERERGKKRRKMHGEIDSKY